MALTAGRKTTSLLGRVPSRTLGPPFSGSMNPTPLAEGRAARLGALDQFESRQRLSRHPA
jgi:hypothetical protein